MSRLTIDLTDQQHKELKAVAALQGKTMREYAVERLFPQSGDDADWAAFKAFVGKRVEDVEDGDFSDKTAVEIFDEELGLDKAA